ncbi:MAG: hypothetical protein CMH56_00090 [Myxococcales bacterium]|nr:hypothetical protein [Myxococcales bacterium]
MSSLAQKVWRTALRAQLNPKLLGEKSFWQRLSQVGNGAFWIVAGVTFFAGAAFCQQAAFQAQALLGDQSFIGPEYIVLAFKSFGPLVVALALMSKVGSAFAAELALMRQNQSLDALVLYKQNPGARWCAPMGLALTFGAVGLGLLSTVVWELAGMVVMYGFHGIMPQSFFRPDAISRELVLLCCIKNAAFGQSIYWVSLRSGLFVGHGTTATGFSPTQAMVRGVLLILFVNLFIDFVWLRLGF